MEPLKTNEDAQGHGNPVRESISSLSDGYKTEPSPGPANQSQFSLVDEEEFHTKCGEHLVDQGAEDGDDGRETEVEFLRTNENESLLDPNPESIDHTHLPKPCSFQEYLGRGRGRVFDGYKPLGGHGSQERQICPSQHVYIFLELIRLYFIFEMLFQLEEDTESFFDPGICRWICQFHLIV